MPVGGGDAPVDDIGAGRKRTRRGSRDRLAVLADLGANRRLGAGGVDDVKAGEGRSLKVRVTTRGDVTADLAVGVALTRRACAAAGAADNRTAAETAMKGRGFKLDMIVSRERPLRP